MLRTKEIRKGGIRRDPFRFTRRLKEIDYKDFGDVVELIRANDLDEAFAKRVHSSVRDDYLECLEEKRREDLYEARRNTMPRDEATKKYS